MAESMLGLKRSHRCTAVSYTHLLIMKNGQGSCCLAWQRKREFCGVAQRKAAGLIRRDSMTGWPSWCGKTWI